MNTTKKRLTKRELVLAAWKRTGTVSVGAEELRFIRQRVEQELGHRFHESPASLARILADAGIPLRHPEVLDSDSTWREGRIFQFFDKGELNFETIESAINSVGTIEALREQFASEEDVEAEKALIQHVVEIKNEVAGTDGPVAVEVVNWLRIWLQNPKIFTDWLALRRNSPDFVREFGG